MKRTFDRILLALGVVLVAATVVVGATAGVTPQETSASGGGGGGGDGSITIKGFAYMPKDLTVKAGTKVTWTNQDSQAHTASSAESGGFDSGSIGAGAKKTVTLDKPGTFAYVCEFHPTMKANLTVE